jgi:hypothetical protein
MEGCPTIQEQSGQHISNSPDQTELLHRALPAARPVVFVEAGHLAHQELPEDTAGTVCKICSIVATKLDSVEIVCLSGSS